MESLTTSEFIKDAIQSNSSRAKEMMRLYNLYKGDHDILRKPKSSDYKPSNKIVNRYFRYVVDYPASYFLGIPPVIQHNKSNNIQDALNTIITDNDLDDLLYEACKETDIKGNSYLLVYLNENSETKIVRVPAEEMIVERNARTNEIELAIRYYSVYSITEKKDYIFAEVYTANTIEYWIETSNGEFVLDMDIEQNPTVNKFGRVPVVKIVSNEEEESIISVVESLVNDYDKIFSDSSDMHELFKNLQLIVKNCSLIPVDENGNIDNEKMIMMLKLGVWEIEDTDDREASIDYLKRELNVDATEKHLDRLNKNIHKFACVPDLSDENFSQNLSGVSIKFKYAGLDIRVGQKERKLKMALNELLKILQYSILMMTGEKLKLTDMDIKFARNIPQNDTENTENVVKKSSLGVYDKETILAMLGEKDPMAILEKKRVEDEEEAGADYRDFHDVVEEDVE